MRYRERWRPVRLRDLMPIARSVLRGQSTEVGGPTTRDFERRFAALTGTRYALAMNTGTATLHSAYFAVGVKPGYEVIVPAYTFPASASAVLACGGTPVFCDIDERTLTLDPADVERRITPRTRAICAVHVWGNPAALDRLVKIARSHEVALIEDASHAHGATYHGRPVGSWGHIGCFSLQGQKAVSGGEAGVAVTSNPVLFDRMLALGHFGRTRAEQAAGTFAIGDLSLGVKYRPHLFGLHLAKSSLSRLAELNRLRRQNLALLEEVLKGCSALETIEAYEGAERGGFLSFLLKYDPDQAGGWSRDSFIRAARAEGVPASIDRYTAIDEQFAMLHQAPIFNSLDTSSLGSYLPAFCDRAAPALPVTERLSERLISLPAFAKVSARFVRQCGEALRKVADFAAHAGDCRAY
jgi:dTDP-4-amino-4,6-dideoxygalactose transaminase